MKIKATIKESNTALNKIIEEIDYDNKETKEAFEGFGKGIETRPGMTKLANLGLGVFGLFFCAKEKVGNR